MAKVKYRKENSFSGGINQGVSPFAISESDSTEEYGWDFDEFPRRKTRKGLTNYGASGGAVTHLLTNYGNTHLVRAVGTKLQYDNSGTWADLTTGLAAADWDAVNFRGKLILTNGTDNVKQYNGSAVSDLNSSDAPKGKYITASINRVYIADGSTIYFSANNDETDWTTAEDSGADDFTVNGGDVTGLTYFRDQVTVFKKNAIGVYYGNNYFTQKLVTVSNDIGCVAYKTIKEVGDTLYFLGQNDVYAFQGGVPVPIGHGIRTYLDGINPAQIAKCNAYVRKDRYYLNLVTGGATEPNVRLVYDPRYGKWRVCALNEGIRYGAFLNNAAYIGDSSGQTYTVEGNTNNGTAIPWSITTKPFDEGKAEAEKYYSEAHFQGLFASGTTVTLAVSTQDRSGSFEVIDFDPTSASNFTQNRNVIIPLDTVPLAFWARFRLSGTGPVELEQMQRYFRLAAVQK